MPSVRCGTLRKKTLDLGLDNLLIGLKDNCRALLRHCVAAFESVTSTEEPVALDITKDKRGITREVSMIAATNVPTNWKKVATFVRVKRSGFRIKGKKNPNRLTKKQRREAKEARGAAKEAKGAAKEAKAKEAKEARCAAKEAKAAKAKEARGAAKEAAKAKEAKAAITPTSTTESPVCTAINTAIDAINTPVTSAKKPIKVSKAEYFEETSYYILQKNTLTLPKSAAVVRDHWKIENLLHRTKDVELNEDKHKIKDKNIASNLSQIFNFVLNTLTFTNQSSVKKASEALANDVNALFGLVATTQKYTLADN